MSNLDSILYFLKNYNKNDKIQSLVFSMCSQSIVNFKDILLLSIDKKLNIIILEEEYKKLLENDEKINLCNGLKGKINKDNTFNKDNLFNGLKDKKEPLFQDPIKKVKKNEDSEIENSFGIPGINFETEDNEDVNKDNNNKDNNDEDNDINKDNNINIKDNNSNINKDNNINNNIKDIDIKDINSNINIKDINKDNNINKEINININNSNNINKDNNINIKDNDININNVDVPLNNKSIFYDNIFVPKNLSFFKFSSPAYLYSSLQCKICGLRYFQYSKLTVHLDDHRRKTNALDNSLILRRNFFSSKKNYNSIKLNLNKEFDKEIIRWDKESPLCEICKKKINKVWNDDEDCWVLENSSKVTNKEFVHRDCVI